MAGKQAAATIQQYIKTNSFRFDKVLDKVIILYYITSALSVTLKERASSKKKCVRVRWLDCGVFPFHFQIKLNKDGYRTSHFFYHKQFIFSSK